MAGVVKVICDNRLRIPASGPGSAPAEFVEDLRVKSSFKNPEYGRHIARGFRYTKEPKTYDLCRVDKQFVSVPRGSMDLLRKLFDSHGLDYEVEDQRTVGDALVTGSYEDAWNLAPGCLFPPYKRIPWDHQVGIIDAIEDFEQVLIRSPTGSGKTSAVIAAISKLSVPALVVMWETGLLEQWQKRIEEELGIERRDQGLIQGGTFRLRGITLAMQQTLNKWDEEKWKRIEGVFGFVGFDEAQRYSSKTFTATADRFTCRYRVAVSADERRKDGKQFLIYAMFGPVRHEVKKQELIDKRIVHEVEVYVVPTEFHADWYIKMREDAREDPKKKDDPQAYNRLLDEMEGDAKRNALASHLVAECVNAGLPTLTFTHRVSHARLMDSLAVGRGLKSGLALGGVDNASTFTETIMGLRSGSLQVGCGTFGKLGTGHDIPTVAAGIAVTPVYNNRPFMEQVKGRICRTSAGKENARIIVLWDRWVFGDVPLHNLKRWNKTVRVWCMWEKCWKEISTYLREGRDEQRTSQADSDIAGIFATAQSSK